MKLKDLYDLDINRLNAADTKAALRIVQNNVNKQIRRWDNYTASTGKSYSPAARGLIESGGLISAKGKSTVGQQRKELARGLRFLQSKTRTIAGWETQKEINTASLNRHLASVGKDHQLTVEDYDRFYAAYEKAKEINPNIASLEMKYDIMERLAEEVTDYSKSPEELAAELAAEVSEIYEAKQAADVSENISDFF